MTDGPTKKKVWFAEGRSDLKASVDGKSIPHGKKNAIELTDGQIERLKASGVNDLQSE